MTFERDMARLRERVETLEEEKRQLSEALAPRISFAALGLSPGEGVVVAALIAAGGAVVTKDRLMLALYGFRNDVPDIRIVDVWICKARAKLCGVGARIATHWGVGYAMDRASVALVERALQARNAGGAVPTADEAPVEASDAPEPTAIEIRIVRGYAVGGRRAGWIAAMTGLEKAVVETILRA